MSLYDKMLDSPFRPVIQVNLLGLQEFYVLLWFEDGMLDTANYDPTYTHEPAIESVVNFDGVGINIYHLLI